MEGLGVEFLISWEMSELAKTVLLYRLGSEYMSQLDGTYLSRGNIQLNLPMVSTHQNLKFLTDTLQNTEPVILSKSLKEVLQDLALFGTSAHNLLQFLDDVGLVGDSQGRGIEDGGKFGVPLEDLTESGESLGSWFEA